MRLLATLSAAWPLLSHARTVGIFSVESGLSSAFIAPQSEWPQTAMWLYLERGDGVLDDGADAAEHLAIGRHHVADVARDEDIAGAGAGDGFDVDARIGAGNDERVRLLWRGGGEFIFGCLVGMDLGLGIEGCLL